MAGRRVFLREYSSITITSSHDCNFSCESYQEVLEISVLQNFSDHHDEHQAAVDDIIKHISDSGRDSYRSDMISDVNAGLGVMATGIRVISAILTVLLGGTGNRR